MSRHDVSQYMRKQMAQAVFDAMDCSGDKCLSIKSCGCVWNAVNNLTDVWLAEKADLIADAVAKEREACAALEQDVYFRLIGTEAMPCGCGNGRIPTTSFSDATAAFAAAIRKRGLTP